MKRTYVVALAVILATLAIGASITLTGSSVTVSKSAVGTYANSQVDTLTWVRTGNETGASFFIKAGDSVSITNVILRRQFWGTLLAAIAGDTILGSTASTANTGYATYGTITLSPYCDTVKIIVNYDTTNNGVTSPYVQYGVAKKFR